MSDPTPAPPFVQRATIEGFKSIVRLDIELGRVTVLIGENGAGKSNILEAVATHIAALLGKSDREYLAVRGIRVASAGSAFEGSSAAPSTRLFRPDRKPYDGLLPEWVFDALRERIKGSAGGLGTDAGVGQFALSLPQLEEALARGLRPISGFLIYSPEYSALRTFREETQILPLGVNGSGLFGHLKDLSQRDPGALAAIANHLKLLGWFDGFDIPTDLAPGERTLRIRDRFLRPGAWLDTQSTNEGFLFLLFYFTLMISRETPRFFAIDNVDASLNPKLCIELVRRLVQLAKAHDKQVILTTHNPSLLDGLDLTDPEQRLYAISRSSEGHTVARAIHAPKPIGSDPPMRLSEAFMRGYIGGLPKAF